jgi:hypothetical protein
MNLSLSPADHWEMKRTPFEFIDERSRQPLAGSKTLKTN